MSIGRKVNKGDVVRIYDGMLLSHEKKNETLPFITWMDLENVMLSEIS